MNRYAFATWNIIELKEEDLEITNRTNYVIKELSEEYCRLPAAIRSGKCNRPKRTVYNEIEIPFDLKTSLN
ncbi:hypothetical protein HZS_6716 [Henneguya salminicola]|nr:hypothetical protein HZS_6716 [Henneguya salminicola]